MDIVISNYKQMEIIGHRIQLQARYASALH